MFNAPGGHPASHQVMFADDVVDRLVSKFGYRHEDAYRFVICFGRVAQELILEGSPIGIPYVGTLFIHRHFRRLSTKNPAKLVQEANSRLRNFNGRDGAGAERLLRVPEGAREVRSLRVAVTSVMASFYNRNIIYTGDFMTQLNAVYARRRERRARTAVKGSRPSQPITPWTAYQPERAHMTNNLTPESQTRRPGLIVEDADAAVDVDDRGRQQVVKTPDRKEVADKRGLGESQV